MLRLAYGEFIGEDGVSAKAGGFDLRLMSSAMREAAIGPHSHEDAHFVLLLSGVYVSSAKNAPDMACGPMLIFNPADIGHHDRYLSRGRFLAVTLSEGCAALLHEAQPESREPIVLRDAGALSAAFRLADETRRGPGNPLALEGLCWRLLDSLHGDSSTQGSRPPTWLLIAHEMIWTSDPAPTSTREVAAQVGIHPVHLARAYRRHFGCAPGEALRGRRLERAAAMLGGSRATLAHIAADTGFADQSHFSRAFQASSGMSPRRYRGRGRDVAEVQEAGGPTR